MERSRMPDNTAGASLPVRLLPVVMPELLPDLSGTWSQHAICRGEDPDIFFPAYGDPGTRARRICANCPVQIDCLQYAITADEWGIWGGLDGEQRRALREVGDESGAPLDHALVGNENRERA
jgi:WhiB family transcriptional regulator, redox-sensing transcriptional regulator